MRVAGVGRVSLLDRPRDAVSLRPEVDAVDEYGTPTRVPGPPVMVGGRMQPIQFGEDGDATSNMTVYKFITRSLPPGAWSTVEWRGRTFDVVGEPRRSNGSRATRHDSIICRAQQPEVIP